MNRGLKLIQYLFILFVSINISFCYSFELLNRNSKSLPSCKIHYDNFTENIVFENKYDMIKVKEKFEDSVSINCNKKLWYVKLNIYNDDRDLVYSNEEKYKKDYKYNLNIRNIKFRSDQYNNCNVSTGSYLDSYKFDEREILKFEFIEEFKINCEKSLIGSSVKLYSGNDKIKFKTFNEDIYSYTLNLNDEIIDYNKKVELYLVTYDRDDKFKCETYSEGEKINIINNNTLVIKKILYTNSKLNINCDYKFKQIQIYVEDTYLNKEINSYVFNNTDNIKFNLSDYIPKKRIQEIKEVTKNYVYKFKIENNETNETKEVEKEISKNETNINISQESVYVGPVHIKMNGSQKENQIEEISWWRRVLNWF